MLTPKSMLSHQNIHWFVYFADPMYWPDGGCCRCQVGRERQRQRRRGATQGWNTKKPSAPGVAAKGRFFIERGLWRILLFFCLISETLEVQIPSMGTNICPEKSILKIKFPFPMVGLCDRFLEGNLFSSFGVVMIWLQKNGISANICFSFLCKLNSPSPGSSDFFVFFEKSWPSCVFWVCEAKQVNQPGNCGLGMVNLGYLPFKSTQWFLRFWCLWVGDVFLF